MKQLTTREAARIINLPDRQIRAYARAGFIAPARGAGGRFHFSFQDLLLLKTAKGLLESQIPVRKIFQMLGSLKRQLPDVQHLARLKIYADGRRVVAWDGRTRWQPDSGQFLFNFDARAMAEKLILSSSASKRLAGSFDAEHWFQLGLELEKTSREEARRAYHMALDADPSMADAHINLGKLYHDDGDFRKAVAHYRAAIEHAPDNAAPHFNLAVALEDLQRPRQALRAYRQAVALDSCFADAHYNLGLLLESLGRRTEAIAHFRIADKLSVRR